MCYSFSCFSLRGERLDDPGERAPLVWRKHVRKLNVIDGLAQNKAGTEILQYQYHKVPGVGLLDKDVDLDEKNPRAGKVAAFIEGYR